MRGAFGQLTFLALLIAACGDDDASSTGGGAATTTAAATSPAATSAGATSDASSGGGGDDGAGGGSGGTGGGGTTFDEPTVFAHLVEPFETEAECEAAQDPEFFFNCWQILELCPDGSAGALLTDIVGSGTYARGDGVIETTWDGAAELPPEVTFTILSETDIEDDAYGYVWTRTEDDGLALGMCAE